MPVSKLDTVVFAHDGVWKVVVGADELGTGFKGRVAAPGVVFLQSALFISEEELPLKDQEYDCTQ